MGQCNWGLDYHVVNVLRYRHSVATTGKKLGVFMYVECNHQVTTQRNETLIYASRQSLKSQLNVETIFKLLISRFNEYRVPFRI
jgi:hypothetical protein